MINPWVRNKAKKRVQPREGNHSNKLVSRYRWGCCVSKPYQYSRTGNCPHFKDGQDEARSVELW